jgi:hypothetical protein
VWILAFILAGALIARGQPLPDIATDNELFAAYCLGMAQASLGEPNDPRGGKYADTDAAAKENTSRAIARFRAYLIARGLTTTRSLAANQGVVLSVKRGRTDWPLCRERQKLCVRNCPFPDTPITADTDMGKWEEDFDRVMKCNKDCMDAEPVCRTAGRCFQGNDQLPF